jgi:1-phosphatidylinositol-3-phosphate 5-kinase
MHFTVFAAYHLILETSFFEDQRVFLNDKSTPKETSVTATEGTSPTAYDVAALSGAIPSFPSHDDSPALRLFHATSNSYADVNKPTSPRNMDSFSSVSSSSANDLEQGASIRLNNTERLTLPVQGPLRKLFADMLSHQNIYLPVTSLQEANDNRKEVRAESGQETVSNGFHRPKIEEPVVSIENGESINDAQKQEITRAIMPGSSSVSDKSGESPVMEDNEAHTTSIVIKEKYVDDDQADDALDSHSILILMSSQCTEKQVICEQSHLTRIKYYGSFDVSLGRYLQDILQNQVTLFHNLLVFCCHVKYPCFVFV